MADIERNKERVASLFDAFRGGDTDAFGCCTPPARPNGEEADGSSWTATLIRLRSTVATSET